jgi:hypothetical protein
MDILSDFWQGVMVGGVMGIIIGANVGLIVFALFAPKPGRVGDE